MLDRLKVDIEGLKVFNEDPVLPPNGYAGRSWNFYPKVHIQDNIGSLSKSGNIFLYGVGMVHRKGAFFSISFLEFLFDLIETLLPPEQLV